MKMTTEAVYHQVQEGMRIAIPVFSNGQRFTNMLSLFGYIEDDVNEHLRKSTKKIGVADWQKKDITFDVLALPKSMVDVWSIAYVDVNVLWDSERRCLTIVVQFNSQEHNHSSYITKLYYKV